MSKDKKKNKGRKFDLLVSRRLINLSSTIFLVVVLLIAYFLIASILKTVSLPTIDMTGAKLYSLSKQTKEALKQIDKDVDIYALNFTDADNETSIIKQFARESSKIHVSIIPDSTKTKSLITKYSLDENTKTPAVVIECGNEFQVVFGIDMYIEYQKTNKSINLVEEKIINSIISVTSETKKKIYIYENNSNHTITSDNLSFINDLVTYGNKVELLKEDKIPDDCDLLVMPGLEVDITDQQSDYILDYVRKGKNILVLQSNDAYNSKYPNLQRILDEYKVKIGDGLVFDDNLENNLYGNADYIIEKTNPSKMTNGEDRGIYVFSINTAPINYLENDGTVEYEVLCETSDKTFIRTNTHVVDEKGKEITTRTSSDGEYKKEIIGILANKKFDGKESNLLLFGSDEIIVDVAVQFGQAQQYLSYMNQNKLFVIDAINYLVGNDKVVKVEKVDMKPEFKGEESDFESLRVALLVGASSIVVVGIIVWYVRRKRI